MFPRQTEHLESPAGHTLMGQATAKSHGSRDDTWPVLPHDSCPFHWVNDAHLGSLSSQGRIWVCWDWQVGTPGTSPAAMSQANLPELSLSTALGACDHPAQLWSLGHCPGKAVPTARLVRLPWHDSQHALGSALHIQKLEAVSCR